MPKKRVPSPRALRCATQWSVLAGCIAALAGCAGSQESQRAYATPGSEPDIMRAKP